MAFDPVDPKQSFPALEHGLLQYWREEDIFKRSVSTRKGGETFSFYDGPPFATGLPHYGHLLAGTIKDVIPRYQAMQGKHVQRRFGWDCHGLPVEYEIEKENGFNGKRDIEKIGVAGFNALCRAAVQRYAREWRTTVERMGRWVDMDHDYRTMDPDYMESIWWVFQSLYDQELIYEGHKPMHVCPRCVTPLSNFEVTQGYKDITDVSVTTKFAVTGEKNTFFLAWTTTPWTLPGNVFLAVHPKLTYATVESAGHRYIVAEKLVANVFKDIEHAVHATQKGKDLIGKTYEPLFPYFAAAYQEKAFKVVGGDFVTTDDGTGIVHIAPGFGEDDYLVGKREKVPLLQHVTPDGRFTDQVTDFAGLDVKPREDTMKTDRKIVEFLEAQGKVFGKKSIRHSYPHCWRCDSPLLNYAASSWFVAVEKIKEDMLAANAKTTWVPDHIRDGRFGKWLEGARDWAISRDRYWGTPLPIWRCKETKEIDVIGSRDDLLRKHPIRFTKVTVVRHGESQGNVDQIYQGKNPGTDLTKNGRAQAKATAEILKDDPVPISAIYVSPLNRTQQTAQALADLIKVSPIIDERIREVHFGEYEGKHIDFDDLTFVRARRAHKIDKEQVESIYHFEGMETWDQMEQRCRAFLEETLPKHRGEHITIYTHADLVMNFRHLFTGEDKHKIVHQPYPNLAEHHTFYWDHETQSQMDLHKETVDSITWGTQKDTNAVDVTLVRHGETDLNKSGKIQGSDIDAPLNDAGRAQVRALAKKLKGQTFDAIISSDLSRAVETAQILSETLGVPHTERWPELRERNLGTWSGKDLAYTEQAYPPMDPQPNPGFHYATPEDGESLNDFLKRAEMVQAMLYERYAGKRVLVVSHRGTMQALQTTGNKLSYREGILLKAENAGTAKLTVHAPMRRIPDVLDCWFESGSMPYAQIHWPFSRIGRELHAKGKKKMVVPPNFPADFIAEGLDQTRGWFYTLIVLSAALFKKPAFQHCVVNGIVLAEDGKKMSKRLKNYPEPTEIVEKYGADAIRFALMHSPAVRAEDLKFSEKVVEEKLRNVLIPLWNSYSFFVTYANAAGWEPPADFSLQQHHAGDNVLDRWIILKTQDLVNKMTDELDRYDLSASCDHLFDAIDGLTNWYIRLNRRRFAGKGADQAAAFDTLYRVLLTTGQLLAPFCPFLADAMYLNLADGEHSSIHLTDWPKARALTKAELTTIGQMEDTRTIVQLGLSLRSSAKVKVRQPLQRLTFALPPKHDTHLLLDTIKEELNVKEIVRMEDAGEFADAIVQIDARKVGPRLGGKVQDVIKAAKAGDYSVKGDAIIVLGETFSADEAKLVYQGRAGTDAACDRGIVVALDMTQSPELKQEGVARELIRAVQQLRKDSGLTFTDKIALMIEGADDVMQAFGTLIAEETRSELASNGGAPHALMIDEMNVTIRFEKR